MDRPTSTETDIPGEVSCVHRDVAEDAVAVEHEHPEVNGETAI